MGVFRKAKRRVETLIAWAIALFVVFLLGAGVYWVVTTV